jgi:hypothetical protein
VAHGVANPTTTTCEKLSAMLLTLAKHTWQRLRDASAQYTGPWSQTTSCPLCFGTSRVYQQSWRPRSSTCNHIFDTQASALAVADPTGYNA